MRRPWIIASLLPAAVAATGLVFGPTFPASADPCPQVEVVFARGRIEPPGPGRVGEAFVDALRSKTPHGGLLRRQLPRRHRNRHRCERHEPAHSVHGSQLPQHEAGSWGYSLGAAVTDVVLGVPAPAFGYDNPLPLGMNDHIAAVALFGNGTRKVLGPVSEISPLYGYKTIDLCTADDPICNNNLDPNTWIGDFLRTSRRPTSTRDWSTKPPRS